MKKEHQSLAKWQALSAQARFVLTSLLLAAGLVVHSPWTAYGQASSGELAKPDWKVGDYWIVKQVDQNPFYAEAGWLPPVSSV